MEEVLPAFPLEDPELEVLPVFPLDDPELPFDTLLFTGVKHRSGADVSLTVFPVEGVTVIPVTASHTPSSVSSLTAARSPTVTITSWSNVSPSMSVMVYVSR